MLLRVGRRRVFKSVDPDDLVRRPHSLLVLMWAGQVQFAKHSAGRNRVGMILPRCGGEHSNQNSAVLLRIASADFVQQTSKSQFGGARVDVRQIVLNAAVGIFEFERKLEIFRHVRRKKTGCALDSGAMQIAEERTLDRIRRGKSLSGHCRCNFVGLRINALF